jgi:hypothetical protein
MSKTPTPEQPASKQTIHHLLAGVVLVLVASIALVICLLAWQEG